MLCLSDSIRDDDPSLQRLLCAVEEAQTLTELLMAAWPLASLVVVHLVEAVLDARARPPTAWPHCPACGALLESKGFVQRQVTSLFGPMRWRRRVGRCPQGCPIPQMAPFDEELGVQPHQRSSAELQFLGCALAVFVPFATAARLLSWYSATAVSPCALWRWVQASGQRAMVTLQGQWDVVGRGDLPPEEPLEAELASLPLALGADGVMVPFRPERGQPTGKTAWREVNDGLNVVENWNSANGFIFYGKSGEIAINRLDDQELSVLSLHLLQACLVYVNTLMLQEILAAPAWMGRMTREDFRALSPLVYAHVNPYGTFELDMTTRLPLAA